MSALNNSLLLGQEGGGGYSISRSLRFNSSDSAYLSRTPASAGNRKTWTWAGWVKRSRLDSSQTIFAAVQDGNNGTVLQFTAANAIQFFNYVGGAYAGRRITTAVYRDLSAWYHIVLAWDSANGTTANRIRLYVNGVEVTTFDTTGDPGSSDSIVNSTNAHYIGADVGFNNQYSNQYLADIYFVNSQALDPTSFGEFDANGIWQPIAYTGSYGTNGFKLDFSDNSAATATTLGKDSSGNGNNWTPNNLSVTAGAGNDSLVDVPTNGSEVDTGSGGQVRGNYCTWNPLDANSSLTISNGNLELTNTNSTARNVRGTIAFPSSGKWYYEITPGGSVQGAVGIGSSAVPLNVQNAASQVIYFEDGSKGVDASRTTYGASYSSGTVIGVAFDADSNQVTFYKNNVSQGAIGTTAGVQYFPFVMSFNATYVANFGQRPFAYTAPSGFKALCTANLPAPVVTKPSTVMDVKLYTGNGSTQTISGLGFSPDFIWTKSRSRIDNNVLHDIVRGRTSNLYSDLAASENTTTTSTADLVSFDANGYTLGTVQQSAMNRSGETYVAWTWDAGSSTVTNTQGSISSQVRANASAGFSVATLTTPGSGTFTVGHGLNVAPSLVICKARNQAFTWIVYHRSAGAGNVLVLNTTAASAASATVWQNTNPSSTLVYGDVTNWGTANYVMYSFAPVAGYSSFGSYTGNGSTDGPFVYTGFRPRWIMWKCTTAAYDWDVYDAVRDPRNAAAARLKPNSSDAEATLSPATFDILSNGFKLRANYNSSNASSQTFIYAAFAEHPFQYARAR